MCSYDPNGFWKENRARVMVDFAREKALKLLDAKGGERIIDAGCGAGTYTLRIAERGASVLAFDKNTDMLAVARVNVANADISYIKADIVMPWPCEAGCADAVLCMAVLMHEPPGRGVQQCIYEAYRALHTGGRLVLSMTHEDLYKKSLEKGDLGWLKYEATTSLQDALEGRTSVREFYRNAHGLEFISDVWVHRLVDMHIYMHRAGFHPQKIESYQIIITPEMLPNNNKNTASVGVAGFLQLRAWKE